MQKSQIVINGNKKASSAVTPKASHLTLIPTANRNIAMNNNTAQNLNNQDIMLIANEARRTAELINKSASALRSIGRVISLDQTNKCTNSENYSFAILDGLTDAIELIANNLDFNGNELGNSLIKGGFINE